uniref:C-type lectin domain-containing protein n=1 Tax=Castor canadensis TaxID=51338 RepID=A0A8C0XPA6_CASCN
MSDFREARTQQLENEELMTGGIRYSIKGSGSQPTSRFNLFAGSKVSCSQGQSKINQELSQLKAGVDRLCRRCPWDWTFFQGNCYFFSKSQRNWKSSITACQEVGAQIVIIESDEEQSFLQQTSKNKGQTWMGMSDLNEESTWHWVDGSPLSSSFKKYWNKGEPNNAGEEDCAEFSGGGWNDASCDTEKFWICKNSSLSCSNN